MVVPKRPPPPHGAFIQGTFMGYPRPHMDIVWAQLDQVMWGLAHAFSHKLYLTRDLVDNNCVPSTLAQPKCARSVPPSVFGSFPDCWLCSVWKSRAGPWPMQWCSMLADIVPTPNLFLGPLLTWPPILATGNSPWDARG